MIINFERIRLQLHIRQLYDGLGACDAEVLIADAWQREMARHDTIQQQQAQDHARSVNARSKTQHANDNKSHYNAQPI